MTPQTVCRARRCRSTALLLCLCLLTALVLPAVAAERAPEPSLYLVALGDSITTGYQMPGGRYGCANYVNGVAAEMGWTRENYVNFAVDGYTVEDLLEEIPKHRAELEMAPLVVFDVGYNDILNPILNYMADVIESEGGTIRRMADFDAEWAKLPEKSRSSREADLANAASDPYFAGILNSFSAGVGQALDLLYEYNPAARVYMQSIYDPLSMMVSMKTLSSAVIGALNAELKKNADARESCSWYDVYAAFDGHEPAYTYMNSGYDIHPNETGHAVMRELFLAALAADGITPETAAQLFSPPPSATTDDADASPATAHPGVAVWLLPAGILAAAVVLFLLTRRFGRPGA